MRFSLIMATINRREEVARMMASLERQSSKDFELILVDQNSDNRLNDLVETHRARFAIVHLRSQPGLSRSRNVGLNYARGEFVSFPDDDCLYPPELLEQVLDWMLENEQYVGLSGRSIDESGLSTVTLFDREAGEIDKQNIWKRMTSIGLFLRWNEQTRQFRFNEELGVGAGSGFGAAEDIDFPLRLLAHGLRLYYQPKIGIVHPPVATVFDRVSANRAFLYGGGTGRVLKLHRYPLRTKARALFRPLGGVALSLVSARPGKARYHWSLFKGRLRGIRS
ncbi:MAG: glycosyltransferase [bacterium]|nr:glycosyltransferase [bacterium]